MTMLDNALHNHSMTTTTKKRRVGRPATGRAEQWGIRFPREMAGEIDRLLAEERRRRPNATRTDIVLGLVGEALAARKEQSS